MIGRLKKDCGTPCMPRVVKKYVRVLQDIYKDRGTVLMCSPEVTSGVMWKTKNIGIVV